MDNLQAAVIDRRYSQNANENRILVGCGRNQESNRRSTERGGACRKVSVWPGSPRTQAFMVLGRETGSGASIYPAKNSLLSKITRVYNWAKIFRLESFPNAGS